MVKDDRKRRGGVLVFVLIGAVVFVSPFAAYRATRLENLIVCFNWLMDHHQFTAADGVSRLAEALYPDEPVTQTLRWKAQFVRLLSNNALPPLLPQEFLGRVEARSPAADLPEVWTQLSPEQAQTPQKD